MAELRDIPPLTVAQLELDPLALLRELPGPVAFRVPGADRSRCRGIVTLLHGNEPSGFVGMLRWLRGGATPAIDILCILGAVDAARHDDGFRHRMVPGQRDLNRCFRPDDRDPQAQLAAQILAALRHAECEVIVDLHNNTGPNPSYGVIPTLDDDRLGIVSLFTPRCVVSALRLGTLFEATGDTPCVAVECGQAGDPGADDVAHRGIEAYAAAPHMPQTHAVDVYDASRRVTIPDGVRVAFRESPSPDADVTFLPAVERYNFEEIPAGETIGWSSGPWPLRMIDGDGRDRSAELFEVVDGQLRTRAPLMPIMVTANPEVATQDCLCYLLARHDQ